MKLEGQKLDELIVMHCKEDWMTTTISGHWALPSLLCLSKSFTPFHLVLVTWGAGRADWGCAWVSVYAMLLCFCICHGTDTEVNDAAPLKKFGACGNLDSGYQVRLGWPKGLSVKYLHSASITSLAANKTTSKSWYCLLTSSRICQFHYQFTTELCTYQSFHAQQANLKGLMHLALCMSRACLSLSWGGLISLDARSLALWALVSCLGQGPLFFKNYIYGNCV